MEVEAAPQRRAPWVGTAISGFFLRVMQLAFALVTLATTITTSGSSSHPALCFLAATSAFQCVCTIPPTLVDLFALLSRQWPLDNHSLDAVVSATVVTDGVAAALSFFAASAVSGVVTMVDDDLNLCGTLLPCTRFRAAAWMGFVSSIALLPTLVFNWFSNNV